MANHFVGISRTFSDFSSRYFSLRVAKALVLVVGLGGITNSKIRIGIQTGRSFLEYAAEFKSEDWNMDMEGHDNHTKLKPSVILTGTAKEGSSGPPVGLVDIGVSEGAYLFRVALPGVRKDQSKVKFEIKSDGKVQVEGVMTGPGLLRESSAMYQMKVQQLCPPGPFTVSFKLPGPVDPRLSSPSFRPDGILEVVVMKSRAPPTVADSHPPL